jgi:hypothetical protein
MDKQTHRVMMRRINASGFLSPREAHKAELIALLKQRTRRQPERNRETVHELNFLRGFKFVLSAAALMLVLLLFDLPRTGASGLISHRESSLEVYRVIGEIVGDTSIGKEIRIAADAWRNNEER